MKKWVALFSHTGSEIVEISKRLGKTPYKIITNQKPSSKNLHPEISTFPEIVFTKNTPELLDYDHLFEDCEDALISLHGWMRILPGSICNQYNIWNLHPGLITKYPELKGKDPQKSVFNMLNVPEEVGCVIHRAIEEVDSGEIYMERSTRNYFYSADKLESYLHEMAEDMWVDFLNTKLYYHG